MLERITGGWPVEIVITDTLPGPASVVWELITDWEHQDDWMLEASDFAVLSDQREGIGVEAEATIKIGGLTTRDRVRVSKWEPNHVLAIEHLGWVKGTGEFSLTPLTEWATSVEWRESLRPPLGAAGAAGMTLLKPVMRRIFGRDMRVLVSLVRARSAVPAEH